MEIFVAILVIAVVAAVAFAVIQRRRGPAGAGGRDRARSPIGRRGRAVAGRDPMAAAVADHAAATDPHDVVVAEQRLQAQAAHESARLQGQARSQQAIPVGYDDTFVGDPRSDGYAEPAHVNGYDRTSGYIDTPSGYSEAPPTSDMHLDDSIDPQTGERVDGYGDPENDPRLNDRRYDGRLASDYVDPPNDERPR
ncbi:MAG TPA: hypothetical protein VGO80_13610 [Solirubrobacteraceae bacterium]|jgi:hypothetical protein|nr:hypothetical protein [Solirubrobacteraceae bacterium]